MAPGRPPWSTTAREQGKGLFCRPWPWRAPAASRSQILALAVLAVLLATIVGLSSAGSPWGHGGGSGSTAPMLVGDVLVVALAAALCSLVVLVWVNTPRRQKTWRRAGGGIVTDEIGASLRTSSVVLVAGVGSSC